MPLCFLSQRDPLKSANFVAVISNAFLTSDNSIIKYLRIVLYTYTCCCRCTCNTHKISKTGPPVKAASVKIVYTVHTSVYKTCIITSLTLSFFTMTSFILFAATARTWIITTNFRRFTNWHFFRFCSAFLFWVYRLPFCYFFTLDIATNFCL